MTNSDFELARRLRCLLLQILLPLALAGEAVHRGAMGEGTLGGGDVFALARPGLLRRRLQCAAIREGQFPRQSADLVHRVEVRGRLLVRLSAGQESDARNGARY